MKKTLIRCASVLLALCLLFTFNAAGYGANGGVSEISDGVAAAQHRSFFERANDLAEAAAKPFTFRGENARQKGFVTFLCNAADLLISSIVNLLPGRDYEKYENYTTQNLMSGTSQRKTAPAENAAWNAGYARESIVPADWQTHPYYTAGFFNNYTGGMRVTEILDDQCVTVVALNDNSGSGTAVFVSLDGFAITNANVRTLRERLAALVERYNIVSLNVICSHSHFCIDTSGLGVNLLPFVGKSVLAGITGNELNSVDSALFENLINKAYAAVDSACGSMASGKLFYRTTDISDLITDKQTPFVFDGNINTVRFVPENGQSEIWLVNCGVHPTGLGRNSTQVSAEYPYQIVKYAAEKANARAAFYQGAQAEISKSTAPLKLPEGTTSYETVEAYGAELVKRIMSPDSESEISPYLNVTHAEIFLPADNKILLAAAKLQVINNTCVNTTGSSRDLLIVTELGYVELGDTLGIFLCPGELSPEIAWGGTKPAEQAWNETDWNYAPLQTTCQRKLLVFGLTNDEIGYILPDNDVAGMLTDAFGGILGDDVFGARNSHYPELLSLGDSTASLTVEYFEAMYADYCG